MRSTFDPSGKNGGWSAGWQNPRLKKPPVGCLRRSKSFPKARGSRDDSYPAGYFSHGELVVPNGTARDPGSQNQTRGDRKERRTTSFLAYDGHQFDLPVSLASGK